MKWLESCYRCKTPSCSITRNFYQHLHFKILSSSICFPRRANCSPCCLTCSSICSLRCFISTSINEAISAKITVLQLRNPKNNCSIDAHKTHPHCHFALLYLLQSILSKVYCNHKTIFKYKLQQLIISGRMGNCPGKSSNLFHMNVLCVTPSAPTHSYEVYGKELNWLYS